MKSNKLSPPQTRILALLSRCDTCGMWGRSVRTADALAKRGLVELTPRWGPGYYKITDKGREYLTLLQKEG